MNMDINWSGDSIENRHILQPNIIGQPNTVSQVNNNSDGHSTKPATTTINGVVLHFSEDGTTISSPSTNSNGNTLPHQDMKNDENRHFSNNIKNPHAIRRDVSFRQHGNSSSNDKRHPHNLIALGSQAHPKQTPQSISNVTSVERARARALQAVNYYNSSVLGDSAMEPPAQFSGKL